LQDNVGTDCEVSSFVKPGAQMNEIPLTAREEIRSLQGDDVVVWGWANDIGQNNMKGALRYVTKFVNDNKDILC
jgi:hypothetical protein